ncbi:A-kinase anchor protein 12 isoform X2 [Hyla sarda]|uniref:A-kinase anchor protein 12 isoform X2 n=1 Tax=Hyla sarda TaxID=327740 RepID=UPI0024C286C0|nr:A-kinase anchor protein 12 isoform X2 [Hyla sarda]
MLCIHCKICSCTWDFHQPQGIANPLGSFLLHTNGKIAILNGATDGEELVEQLVEGLQASDVNGHGIEEIMAVVKEVEQQDPTSVTLNEEPAENMGVVQNDTTTKETAKEDEQVETPEANDITPETEEKAESPDQANENQTNEVGFKKVFKFVGFKFTVKKDKTEKCEPVQLLTVKKDEAELNGIDNHEEDIDTADEVKTEIQQETKDSGQPTESPDKPEQAAESAKETPEEDQKKVEESEVEKDKTSPESPTNPIITETSSPFKRFFTQGWAGLRKKTSFKKSKEEDPQEVEKQLKAMEQEKAEVPETVKEENTTEAQPAEVNSVPQEISKSSSEDSKVSNEEKNEATAEEMPKQEEPSISIEAESKLEEAAKVEVEAAPVAEITEQKPEIATSVPAAAALPPEVKTEADTIENNVETQITDGTVAASSPEGIREGLQETSVSGALDNDQPQLTSSTECGELEKSQDAVTTEAELLSSQEKAKIQGSPLKKLFSSSGLRKLSGKKSKSKKEDDSKVEVTTEAVSSESPEAPEVDGGDSSPSSPDESAEASPTEKPTEDIQAAEAEGEGTTSDGERKKDGITPWASFKKLVTPKRRPKRLSESDKEDEVEKAKSSTMSSTDSAGTVENQEEPKDVTEEQKLEKSTDESKKKVDNSVSWEALICVGSSKKRARKASDSDEDEGVKSQDEAKKTEEVVPPKETDDESPITSSQEQPIQESTSPDQAGSPTEGSTWQSFKRLVTPRRKSRTRVEEKTDETVTPASAEQSTSEGEAGKEETWVSFKKLIPGRKKKKSDGKQEHAPTTEAGQPLNEAAEDDSDEPAVVPLAEFDAAEQEKLDAQKSLEVVQPTVLGEQEGSVEKSTEELIHAVTVTVIEGERAITSLDERSPSWISATVSETIEHAKETEEATEIIKPGVNVEETVVLSTVCQVMKEMPTTMINEMELTSEALTALEEAIENSCTEETTEMISAVSQLGESTEDATPVPEEDASQKTLEDQKKQTESILHKVAEKAKLTLDSVQLQASAPLCMEEQTNLTPDCLEGQDDEFTIVSAEETVEQVCVSVIEKTKESVITSETVQNEVDAPLATLEKTVETVIVCASTLPSKEEAGESVLVNDEKNEENLTILSEDQVVQETPICNEAKNATLETVEKCEDASDSIVIESVVQENIAMETVYANDNLPSVEDVKTNEDKASSTEIKETAPALDEVQIEDSLPASSVLQTKESALANVPVSSEVQSEDVAPVSSEIQPEDVPVASDIKLEDVIPISSEILPEISVPESGEIQAEKVVPVSSVQGEVISESSEIQSKETIPVSSKLQSEEVVSSEVRPEEVVPISSIIKPEISVHRSSEVQAEEVVSVSGKAEKPKEAVPVPSEKQPKEAVPVPSEEKPKEAVPVPSEKQPKEAIPVPSEEKPKEAVPVLSEKQPKEAVPVPREEQPKEAVQSEKQPKEAIPVPSEEKPKEAVPVLSEKQPKEAVPVPREEQPKEAIPSEKQPKEAVPVPSEKQPKEAIPVPSEEKPKEAVPVQIEEQPKKAVPISTEEQPKEAVPVLREEQPKEAIPVSSEEQPKEAVPVSSEEQPKEAVPVSNEEQPKEAVPVSSEKQPKEAVPVSGEEQPKEAVPVSSDEQPKETVPAQSVEQPKETVPGQSDEQSKEAIPVSSEEQPKEAVPVSCEEQPKEAVPVSSEEQPKEAVPSEEQPKEAVPVSNEEQPKEAVPVSSEEQPKETVPGPSEEQPKGAVPVSSEEQPKEAVPVSSEAKPKETVPSEEQTKEAVPESSEGQSEEIASESNEVKREECVSLSNEVQAEGSLSALKELQPEVGSLSSEVKNTELHVSEVQSTEEVIPVYTDIEDKSGVSKEVKTEETLPRKSECAPLLVEVQPEGVNVLVKEHAEETVSLLDDKQVIPVPAEAQAEKSVPVTDEVQVEVGASVLAEIKVEESAPVLAEVDCEKTALETAGLKVEESAPVSVEVQADDVQADKAIDLSAEVEPVEISIAIAVVQIDDSTPVSNDQTEGTHRPSEEGSLLSGELQTEESSPRSVQEESILHSDEVQSIEVPPVGLAEEIVQVHPEQKAPVVVEQICDVQSDVSEVQMQEESAVVTKEPKEHIEEVPTLNKVENVENDAQESERVLDSSKHKEGCGNDQAQKPTTEGAETNVLIAKQETTELQKENKSTNSDNIDLKATSPSSAQEEKKSEEENKKDQTTPSQEEVVEPKEEVVTTDIPKLESSEATKTSDPVTAAAVEEQVLAETVKAIEVSTDNLMPSEVAGVDTKAEDNDTLSKVLEVVAESVSHKAAAIVDAAIEAATNCVVVNATSQGDTHEETTVSKKEELTKETDIETITIESCSTTIVQNIIETAVEAVVSSIHKTKTDGVQEQNLENKLDSQLQETVPVSEAIKSCAQPEDSQQANEGVQNAKKEIESSVPADTQEENRQVTTQASTMNDQEKAPTVES